jgi:hypothetical protein
MSIRWMKLPEFRNAYRAARREAVAQSDARLQQACTNPPAAGKFDAAAATLVKIMLDAAPASARVRTARQGCWTAPIKQSSLKTSKVGLLRSNEPQRK